MPRKQNKLCQFTLLLTPFFLLVSLAGCDQITSLKEKIFKSSKKAEAPQAAPAQQATPAKKEPAPMSANALARVGSWTLTIEDFNDRLKALEDNLEGFKADNIETKKLVLEELIRQQILVEDAERSGLAKDKDILAAVDELRRSLIVQEAVRKLVENVSVTDEEAKKLYEERKDVLVQPLRLRVREIVVDSQLKANELSVELLKGSDFAEMAKQNSISSSAANGGDLGFIDQVPFQEMGDVLISLEAGDISSVFKGPEGYYIVKVEEKQGGEAIPYEEIADQIKANILLTKQKGIIDQHIEKVKGSVKVEVREDLLK